MSNPPPIGISSSRLRGICNGEARSVPQNTHPRSANGPRGGEMHGAPLPVGTHVHARGTSWRVLDVCTFPTCRIVTLAPLDHTHDPGATLALITPFDRITPMHRPSRWCAGGVRPVLARLAGALRDTVAAGAGQWLGPELSLVPWQWAAATALLRGDASALLLADAVGLGKTVQAGIVIAALRARGCASRVLILTPAGLRDQWHSELERLFRFRCSVLDAPWLRGVRRTMPADVNPWGVATTAIASMDFVKQPEVLAAATGAPWDVLIVDEAHTLGARTDRRTAAAALASCSRYVLLLTATPHAGSDEGFAALCSVADLPGDSARMLVIRRTRADLGFDASRRVRVARLTLCGAERRMHALLREYAGAVWRERGTTSPSARLAMTVLLKRAASSAWALHCSVGHRLRLLAPEDEVPAQPLLPFDDPGETDGSDTEVPAALGEPGLDERGRELQMLAALGDAALGAATSESKLARVVTLLRRIGEPAIVFTEYRDTLDAAVRALGASAPIAVLHGGLSRAERRDAEREFTGGHARVLLATDVGSEGLNLHARCRLVINLELPWNPVRLEQRVGRVDRIGQRRRVHAVHLVGNDTPEAYVLERLATRVRNIRRSLGETSDAAPVTDTLLAGGALGEVAPHMATGTVPATVFRPRPSAESPERRVCELLDAARLLKGWNEDRGGALLPLVTVHPRARLRLALAPGVVIGFRVEALAATGRPAAAAVMAIHVTLAPAAVSRARASTLVAAILPIAHEAALGEGAGSLGGGLAAHRRYTARARARESALLAAAGSHTGAPVPLVQPGLFDRRALHEAARQHAAREHRIGRHTAHLARLSLEERVDTGVHAEPILALVLR